MELGCGGGELGFPKIDVNGEEKQSWKEVCLLSVPYARPFSKSF